MSKRTGKTDSGRTMFKGNDEEPKSARASKELYQLWKFAETLTPNEIEVLITKRRRDLKYSNDIKKLRTEILLLEDAFRIIKRRKTKEK